MHHAPCGKVRGWAPCTMHNALLATCTPCARSGGMQARMQPHAASWHLTPCMTCYEDALHVHRAAEQWAWGISCSVTWYRVVGQQGVAEKDESRVASGRLCKNYWTDRSPLQLEAQGDLPPVNVCLPCPPMWGHLFLQMSTLRKEGCI